MPKPSTIWFHRAELGNEQRLTKRNPDVFDDQEAAAEVGEVQIPRDADALGVFGEAFEERRVARLAGADATFARTFGDSLADIDGSLWVRAAIERGKAVVDRVAALVVQRVEAGALEAGQILKAGGLSA